MRTEVRNDLHNPFGHAGQDGWTFASVSETEPTLTEVEDDEMGRCLEVTFEPSGAFDIFGIELRNGASALVCQAHEVVFTRAVIKVVDMGAIPPILSAANSYPVFGGISEALLGADGFPFDALPPSIEMFEAAPPGTQSVVPELVVVPLDDEPFTFRIKAQVVTNPWGDVPEFCPRTDDDFDGSVDGSSSHAEVSYSLPSPYGFNDLTYSENYDTSFEDHARLTKQLGMDAIHSFVGYAYDGQHLIDPTEETPEDASDIDFKVAPAEPGGAALYGRGNWFDAIREAGLMLLPTVYWPETTVALIEEWGDIICGVQVWDEPNFASQWGPADQNPDPAGYTELLARHYEAVKSVRDDIPVLGGALALPTGDELTGSNRKMSGANFLDGMYDAGAKDVMDNVVCHPFGCRPGTAGQASGMGPFGGGVHAYLKDIRDVMAAHGDERPLWSTQFGHSNVTVHASVAAQLTGRQAEITCGQLVPLFRGLFQRLGFEGLFIHALWERPHEPLYGAVNYPNQTFRPMAGALTP